MHDSDIDDTRAAVDLARSVCLCTYGAPGFALVVAVDADGVEHLVMAEVSGMNTDDGRDFDLRCAHVPHEQIGALPDVVRDRIGGTAT